MKQQNLELGTAKPEFFNFKEPRNQFQGINSPAYVAWRARAGIFKPLWSPGIDAKTPIPPAYVAWRAGTITLFLLGA
jgi:hypothetical protein